MAATYYSPFIPAFNSNGAPLPGAKIAFFLSGTSTPTPIYADEGLTTQLPNPVPSDAAAKYPNIYLDETITYRVIQTDANGVQLGDAIDPYVPGQALKGDAGPTGPANSTYTTLAGLTAAAVTNASYIFAPPSGSDGGAAAGTFLYQTAGAPYTADGVNVVKLDTVPLTTGALVRQGADSVVFRGRTVAATPRSTQDRGQDVVSVRDFGAKGDGSADDTAAIVQAAAYAATLVIQNNNEESQQSGGVVVRLRDGVHKLADTIVLQPGVSLQGGGRMATVIDARTSTKTAIRNAPGAVYNSAGNAITDLAIYGNSAASGQWAIDLLRPLNNVARDVYIQNTGAGGVRIRQGICCTFDQVETHRVGGPGFLTGEGVENWENPVALPTHYPTNQCLFIGCHANRCEGPGLRFGPYTNGCEVYASTFENSYFGAGERVGVNVELANSGGYMPNVLMDCWVEGPVQTHVYSTAPGAANRVVRLRHFGGGENGNVDRAVVNDAGTLYLDMPMGSGERYRNFSGSTTPFRLNKGGGGIIYLTSPLGSGLSRMDAWVEDETGSMTGLENFLYQDGNNVTRGSSVRHVMQSGATSVLEACHDGESAPWWRLQPFQEKMFIRDAEMRRSDVGILSVNNGWAVGGTKVVGPRVTGVAVTAAAIHAALVAHGLISA